MTTISSGWTRYYKRILPAIWLGIIALWTAIMAGIGRSGEALVHDGALMIVLPIAMVVVAGLIARKVLWSCADEVVDAGDRLLVRRGSRRTEITFDEIESVRSSILMKPHRITLRLRSPGELGRDVTFIPEGDTKYQPFSRSRLEIELGRRAEDARAG